MFVWIKAEGALFALTPSSPTKTIHADTNTRATMQVDSTFANAEGARFEFKFAACALKWRFLELPLPPVGEGWGEQVYLDETLRIQRDSRGDTLIATRV